MGQTTFPSTGDRWISKPSTVWWIFLGWQTPTSPTCSKALSFIAASRTALLNKVRSSRTKRTAWLNSSMKSTLSATPPSSDSSEKHGKNEFVVFFPILKIQSELAHVCRGCVFEIWKNPFWSVHSELHLIDQSYRFRHLGRSRVATSHPWARSTCGCLPM